MGGRNRISIIYAEDAARAIAQTCTAEAEVAGKTYFLDDGNIYSWRDLLAAVEEAVGHRALRLNSSRFAYHAAALVSETYGFILRRPVHADPRKGAGDEPALLGLLLRDAKAGHRLVSPDRYHRGSEADGPVVSAAALALGSRSPALPAHRGLRGSRLQSGGLPRPTSRLPQGEDIGGAQP